MSRGKRRVAIAPGEVRCHPDGSVSWRTEAGRLYSRLFQVDARCFKRFTEAQQRRVKRHLQDARQLLIEHECGHCGEPLTKGHSDCVSCGDLVCLFCLQVDDVETVCLQAKEGA